MKEKASRYPVQKRWSDRSWRLGGNRDTVQRKKQHSKQQTRHNSSSNRRTLRHTSRCMRNHSQRMRSHSNNIIKYVAAEPTPRTRSTLYLFCGAHAPDSLNPLCILLLKRPPHARLLEISSSSSLRHRYFLFFYLLSSPNPEFALETDVDELIRRFHPTNSIISHRPLRNTILMIRMPTWDILGLHRLSTIR